MDSSEDQIICSLRSLDGFRINHPEIQQLIEENCLGLAKRAYVLYCLAFQVLGKNVLTKRMFLDQYLDAWETYFVQAAGNLKQIPTSAPRLTNGCMYATWHFPEYPLFLRHLATTEAHILVARDVEWMDGLFPKERLINFKSNEVRKLASVLRRRLPVVFMHDYCYSGSRSIVSNFLGFPCKSPTGLVSLSLKYNYACCFINSQGDSISISDMSTVVPSPSEKIQYLISILNQFVEDEILKAPHRWLLWPSIDSRWIL